jgi:hypothetical protein
MGHSSLLPDMLSGECNPLIGFACSEASGTVWDGRYITQHVAPLQLHVSPALESLGRLVF